VEYGGGLDRGIVVVNHLRRRGRRLGWDVFEELRRDLPLDLVGMDAESAGGLGEIANLELPAFMARYRFFFNPIRWTSLGLAIVEAMMVGMPVVGLATTELATTIDSGHNGFVHNDPGELRRTMRTLLADRELARDWGRAARQLARERFGIGRFVADWMDVLSEVTV